MQALPNVWHVLLQLQQLLPMVQEAASKQQKPREETLSP
jgi:hypothetical protein